MSEIKFKDKLEVKLTISFLLIILITVTVLSTISYRNSYNLLVNNLGNRSIKIAETAANKIDIKEFNSLKTEKDEKTESYNKIKQQLVSIKDASGAKYIYTMRKDENNNYIYVIDATDGNNGDISHIGDVEKQIEAGYKEVYKGSAYFTKKINITSWGVLVSSYYPLKDANNQVVGFVGVDYDVSKEYSEFQKFKMNFIIIILSVLVISSIFSIAISKNISKPIVKITELLNKIADLDLTYDKNDELLLKHKGEIGIMVSALFNTRKALRSLVISMTESSKSVSLNAQTLSAVSEEMASSAENVSASILGIAKNTGSQTEDLLEIDNKLRDFNIHLSNIVNRIEDIDNDARGIKLAAGKSGNDMNDMVQTLKEMAASFGDLVSKISSFSKDINQINNITNIIKGIATQTNLLALNASIEAARADKSGKGFTVVANEIKKLAEQVKESSENINSLIKNISANTDKMLESSKVMDNEFSNEITVINHSIESFKKIIDSVDKVIPKVSEVSVAALNVDKEKNIIIDKVKVISDSAEEISYSSEEITASSEEMNAATQEVASSAETLNSMTNEMVEQVNKFKL